MMCKLNGQIDNVCIHPLEMIWKSKDGCKRGHYVVQIIRVDG